MAKPLTDQILEYLVHTERVNSLQLSKELEVDHQKVVGAVKSLQSVGEVIKAEQKNEIKVELTTEGKDVVAKGSHEVIVFNAVPAGGDGILQPELMKATGANGKIGMSKAIQNGWIKTVKDGGKNKVVRVADSVDDKVQETLKDIAKGKSMTDTSVINEFKKRKLIVQQATTFYEICRGDGFTTNIEKQETDLTPEMLASGDWKTKNFKAYNFEAKGVPPAAGHLHPLMKVRSEFRSILFEMGFSEMPTNKFVESSFWNFDALYVPQKHPARDAQDTFFVSQPVNCKAIPEDYMQKVRDAHIGGKYGSQGYGSEWKKDEAMKNVMRTHTTAISARMLYEMGQQKEFKPAKLFSIDRVFRNETLDATHLAEFHQVEGVVADRGINLCHLMGIMKEFFGRLGIHRLRFKPAYNPYTEPSMEVFAFHSGLNKWVEVGNSGMFRPEMLLPMGIPEDVNVIAWGLSLERPTMIRYGYDNIRDLVGPRVDLQMVYKSPICRLYKDSSNTSDKTGVTSWEDSVKSSVTHFFPSNSCSGDCSSNPKDLDTSQPDIVKPVQVKKESTMPNDNPLTSHVLDTSKGRPAVGILVKLYKLDSERNWNFLEQQETNKDGRVGNLVKAETFTAGTYKLYFETRSYFANEKTFYPYVEVVFTIEDPTEHYHVPILLSAFGYSTYRGS